MTDTQEMTKVAAADQLSDGDLDANALIAANLRAIRARRGWTQTEVAARTVRSVRSSVRSLGHDAIPVALEVPVDRGLVEVHETRPIVLNAPFD